MLRRPLFPLFLTLILSLSAYGADYQSVASTPFKDAAGNAVSLGESTKPTLLLFWANWCVPCKAELGEISKSPDAWKEFRLISVSIDEAHDRPGAETTLETIQWPFEKWFDEDGKNFATVQESGDLPLTLLFSKDGRFLGKFTATKREKIPEFQALVNAAEVSSEEGKFRLDDVFQYRSLTVPYAPDALAYANTTTLGYDAQNFSAQVESYSIRQRRPGTTASTRWENEFGRTYIRAGGFTLGDQNAHIHQGMLLSLRPLSASDQNSSLLGLSYSRNSSEDEIKIFAGKIRDLLFAYQLDPAQDLTVANPDEWAFGFEWARKFDSRFSTGISAVAYHRNADVALGFPAEKRDVRVGAPFRYRGDKIEASFSPTFYRDLKQDQSIRAGELTLHTKLSPTVSIPVALQESRQDIPRVYFSTLLDAPALPLSVDRKRSLSVGPKITIGKSELTLQGVAEEGFDLNRGDNQYTAYASGQSTEGAWKTHVAFQSRNIRTTGSKTSETFLDGTIQLKKYWLVSAGAKYHSTHARAVNLQTGLDLLSLFFENNDASQLKALILSLDWNDQTSGYYFGYSGINESRLFAVQLRSSYGKFALLLTAGKQPGGLQCTGGVCTQVPALNGVRGTLETHWVF